MRALTLWRPWPWCIFHWPADVAPGPKWIENRNWAPPQSVIGQVIALHAGKTFEDDVEIAAGLPPPSPSAHPLGIIGTARLTGFVHGRPGVLWGYSDSVGKARGLEAVASPWFVGSHGWVLDEVTPLAVPIPCPGAQGLWTVDLEIAGVLEAQR